MSMSEKNETPIYELCKEMTKEPVDDPHTRPVSTIRRDSIPVVKKSVKIIHAWMLCYEYKRKKIGHFLNYLEFRVELVAPLGIFKQKRGVDLLEGVVEGGDGRVPHRGDEDVLVQVLRGDHVGPALEEHQDLKLIRG